MNSLMCQVSHSLLHYLFLTFKYHCLLCKVCLSLLCNINYSLLLVQFYLREPFKKKNQEFQIWSETPRPPSPIGVLDLILIDKFFIFFIWEFSTLKHVLNQLKTCYLLDMETQSALGLH